MAVVTIRTPPDGNDLSNEAASRFQATLHQGQTVKDGIIAAMKQRVRSFEGIAHRKDVTQLGANSISSKLIELQQDPDVGGEDLP